MRLKNDHVSIVIPKKAIKANYKSVILGRWSQLKTLIISKDARLISKIPARQYLYLAIANFFSESNIAQNKHSCSQIIVEII